MPLRHRLTTSYVLRPTSGATDSTVAVILSQFPRYDEAFLLRELTALEREGVPFVIYSLKACRDRVVHDDAARLARRTVYAPFRSPAVWASLVRQIAAAPIATASVAWRLIRYCWRQPTVLAKSLIVFAKAIAFGRLARTSGVRIVHAGWATYPATAAWAMQRLYGLPYGFAGHAHDIYLDTTMLAEKIRAARWVVTCTEENARYLASFADGASDRVVVNHHGLDLGRFSTREGDTTVGGGRGDVTVGGDRWGRTAGGRRGDKGQGTRDEHHVPNRPGQPSCPPPARPTVLSPRDEDDSRVPLVLSVGSLLPCKGFEELIGACRLLRERGVALRCVIAGGGPLETPLRQRIARAGLTDVVTLLGYVSQETLMPWYRRASVFALAAVGGIHWGIPNVIVEALASGVPVICTALPAIREILGQTSGDVTVGGRRGDMTVSGDRWGRTAGERRGDKRQEMGPSSPTGASDSRVPNALGQPLRPPLARPTVVSPRGVDGYPVPGYEVAECGLIVPDRDPAALAAAIERLLRDRPLAERLAAVGRERVRQGWDIRVTGRQLAALLQGR